MTTGMDEIVDRLSALADEIARARIDEWIAMAQARIADEASRSRIAETIAVPQSRPQVRALTRVYTWLVDIVGIGRSLEQICPPAIGDEIGYSRTAMHGALHALARDGWIEIQTRHGSTRVRVLR